MPASKVQRPRALSEYLREQSVEQVHTLWSGVPRPEHASAEFALIADTLDLAWDTANNAIFTEAEADYLMAQLEQLTTAVLEA
jgi:hypothetical protein